MQSVWWLYIQTYALDHAASGTGAFFGVTEDLIHHIIYRTE